MVELHPRWLLSPGGETKSRTRKQKNSHTTQNVLCRAAKPIEIFYVLRPKRWLGWAAVTWWLPRHVLLFPWDCHGIMTASLSIMGLGNGLAGEVDHQSFKTPWTDTLCLKFAKKSDWPVSKFFWNYFACLTGKWSEANLLQYQYFIHNLFLSVKPSDSKHLHRLLHLHA